MRQKPSETAAPRSAFSVESQFFEPPLVSVVIPTYNRPKYLKEALESAVGQTYRHIEILVQDNCSPDDPSDLVAAFGDPRVKLQVNSRNLGTMANFVLGYRRAQGKYVATLNDDDRWEPKFLSVLVAQLEARGGDAVIAFCDHFIIDAQGQIDAKATETWSRRWKRHLLAEGFHQPFEEIALVDRI